MARYDDIYNDLEARTQESYDTRKGDRTFLGVFKPELTLPLWNAREGEHRGNIIPYRAGPNEPRVKLGRMEEGAFTYVLDHYIHRGVGPRDLWFVCMESTYHEPCAICEERNKLRKQGAPEVDRLVKAYEDRLKDMKPKRRVIYNWECLDPGEAEKGVQIWEIAHFCMEEPLMEQAKLPREEGGALINFAHPERGKVIWFRRTGTTLTNTRYSGHKFLNRREPIPPEIIDEAKQLDSLIYIPTYEEVRDAFWDRGSVPDSGGELYGDDGGVDEEVERPAPSRRRSRAYSVGRFEEEPRAPLPPEEEQPGDYGYDQEPEESSVEYEPSVAFDVDDEPPVEMPRRRARSSVASKPPGAVGFDGRPARAKPAPVATTPRPARPKCPVPGGVFGQDGDSFNGTYPHGCEGCPHWTACVKATVAFNRSQMEG